MNMVAICLHCLDMRDFHSALRATPFLDDLRTRTVFIPMGRAQGHHQGDSLNAELTGQWTARHSNSRLDADGYVAPDRCWLPPTILERLLSEGYDLLTCMTGRTGSSFGSWAVAGGMPGYWLKDAPERMAQFACPEPMDLETWYDAIRTSARFYAHVIIRETHRPWGNPEALHRLMPWRERLRHALDRDPSRKHGWPYDAYCARRAALEQPDTFAALRRAGLARADRLVRDIVGVAETLPETTILVYSNHGEVFDHFRYTQPFAASRVNGLRITRRGRLLEHGTR